MAARDRTASRARSEKESGESPGGAGQTLLGSAVERVDPPLVDPEGESAQTGHRVDQEESAPAGDQRADLLDRVADTGGGLGVDDGQQLVGAPSECLGDPFRVDPGAPFAFHDVHFRAQTGGDLYDPPAEHAVDGHQSPIRRFQQIDQARLHAGHAGAGEGEGRRVLCEKQALEKLLDPVHDPDELGVQIAEGRAAQGLVDGIRHRGRSGTHQQDSVDAFEQILHEALSSGS